MLTKAVLPPGVSKAQFAKAIKEYQAIVGEENVFVDLEQLASYSKIMIPEDEVLHQPSGAISATTVEEIQRILAVCNKYKIPVWTISTGRNFGYGSAAPATPGQMVLDLRRMNRILDVDAEMCTALVEPGVTYQQLYDHITERNLPLWLSFPAPGPIVGPVGNTLDRGVGYNRYGDHSGHFCGLEVVLANGDVLRTGMGGVANTNTWQSYRWGYGPWVDGLFQQSNLGVVTKMGLWLMPATPSHRLVILAMKTEEQFASAMDTYRRLRLNAVIENGVMGAGSLAGLALTMRRREIFTGPGAINDAVEQQIMEKFGVPQFLMACTLYGTEEQIETNIKIIKQAFAGMGELMFLGPNLPPEHPFRHLENETVGRLDLHEFGIYNFRGAGGGSAWFSPTLQAKGSEAVKSWKLNKAILEEFGFDYLAGFFMGARHCEHVIALEFDRSNPDELKRAYACYDKMLKVNAAAGYAPYRTNTAFMKQVAEVYGPEQQKFNARLKLALDPNRILAPGKSGM